ncbi:MAG: DUF1003 domain-containing protein [Kineosporiaceae bacterium]
MVEDARAELRRRAAERRALRAAASSTERGRPGLDTPLEARRQVLPTPQLDQETFGRWSEAFARFMGTAQFIVGMTVFVAIWLFWNTFAPERLQFDPRALNYTLLTLLLSLQASYAAPLILLAQNRQADRDRVAIEQDRQRGERGLADTEYLAREVAALRIALRDVTTRDFVRSELREVMEELAAELAARQGEAEPGEETGRRDGSGKGTGTGPGKATGSARRDGPDKGAGRGTGRSPGKAAGGGRRDGSGNGAGKHLGEDLAGEPGRAAGGDEQNGGGRAAVTDPSRREPND